MATTKVITGNKIPYYYQVAHSLNRRVRSGLYAKNQTLPSVRYLSNEFDVSVNVIQRALRYLEKEGVVTTHPGKGVMVIDGNSCKKSAILFGLIHPFPSDLIFEQQVLHFAEEAFASRDNLLVIRSSNLDINNERNIAENLIHNGAQGLLLWPNASNPNGEYFTQMAKHIPIVLVDRLLQGVNLPAVVFDSSKAGKDICAYAFEKLKRKRMLAIMDDLDTPIYNNMIESLRTQAEKMGRRQDLTVIYESIFKGMQDVTRNDYSRIDFCKESIRHLLATDKYDVVFCPHEDFLDYVMIQTGLYDEFSDIKLITTPVSKSNSRTRKYAESDIVKFLMDFPRIISAAADMLQGFVLKRDYNTQVILEPFTGPSEQN